MKRVRLLKFLCVMALPLSAIVKDECLLKKIYKVPFFKQIMCKLIATRANVFPGIVHNDIAGIASSELIVDADISSLAAISDTKLATISTVGKVANSATSATTANVPNTIVLRDASGNFSTNMITIAGTVTNPTDVATKAYVDSGSGNGTSLNTPNTLVLRDGTGSFAAGTITIAAGSAATPSLQFSGSSNTGISAATANTLSFDANGVEKMSISSTAITAAARFVETNVHCNQAIQAVSITGNNQSVTANSTTSVLLLKPTANRTGFTITFPATPTNGQYFTILLGATFSVAIINAGNGASVINGITTISATVGQSAVTYFYYATDNAWYRERTS